ncbi:DnaJ domain-containing protein/DUF3444 domain-containing protein [Cephalotus follicularis]|uniref:DnaJ domain-containing protein/DUF3444 domain-containing protein n=1 Tax=Cephalotus follicularis TaxID=3775 RepID=A0A1Q3C1W9_CEPFO|nr:DnaJ domain-containing protein/DUF3444 domain-containing protein [Cephalotus follicularis]
MPMECNIDDAIRAKEIAEKRLLVKDFAGAEKFALKAQNLYSGLDGLPQLLAALEVCSCAEKKIDGMVDYYRVLGVEPSADNETIRRHYRKLALALHPDKNKSVAAEGAFQIVSEAWSSLSDKAKRLAYDQQRNMTLYANVLYGRSSSSMPNGMNSFHNFTNHNNAFGRDHNGATHPKPASPPYHSSNINPNQKSGTHPSSALPPRHPSKLNTFWTTCNACRGQFEYLIMYLGRNLLCPNCRRPFVAVETLPPPINGNSSSPSLGSVMLHKSNQHRHTTTGNLYTQGRKQASASDVGSVQFSCVDSSMTTSQSARAPATGMGSASASIVGSSKGTFLSAPSSATYEKLAGFSGVDSSKTTLRLAPTSATNVGSAGYFGRGSSKMKISAPASAATQAAGFVLSACQKLKRQHKEAPLASDLVTGSTNDGSSSISKGNRAKKRRQIDEQIVKNKERDMANLMAPGNGGIGSRKGSFGIGKMKVARNSRPNSTRELSQPETRNLCMEKAKKEIRKKLNEWVMPAIFENSDKAKTSDKETREKAEGKQNADAKGLKVVADKFTEFVYSKTGIQAKISSPADSDIGPDTENTVPITMSVPDPDFHDFDKDRIEKSFCENQVWAAYDDDDGMPRYYAMIHGVISVKPFKMQISWLNSKSNDELGPINWISSGFYKTSGDFRIGKHEVSKSLNSFSHKVKWTKGARGAVRIYPMKGDVWALYMNWSPDWNALTPNEVIHKYDMVEVLEGYNEEKGVTVAPLVKVLGFKTVFHKHPALSKARIIPRQEMFRFSHQVPSYPLTGQEGHNAPKDCLELDPASTPLELLHVLTEEMEESAEKSREEDPVEGVPKLKEQELLEDGETKRDFVKDAEEKIIAKGMMNDERTKEKEFLVYRRRR